MALSARELCDKLHTVRRLAAGVCVCVCVCVCMCVCHQLCMILWIYTYIYIYTSVNPRISILVLDEAECSDAEVSGAATAPSNSLFE